MKKPRAYPAKIRGVSSQKPSDTPILIYIDLLDPTTKFGHRGSTIRLTLHEARNLRESIERHIALVEAPPATPPAQGCIHCRPGRLCEYHKPSNVQPATVEAQ